jgi:hypothetical protein
MRKIITVAGAAAATIAICLTAACAMLQSAQTPAQYADVVCTPANAALAVVQTTPNLSATAKKDLATAQAAVADVCTGAASLSISSLQGFLSTGVPLIEKLLLDVGVGTSSGIFQYLPIAVALVQALINGETPPAAPVAAVAARYRSTAPAAMFCFTNGKLPACPAP